MDTAVNIIKKKREATEHQLILKVLGKKKDKPSGGNWAGKEYFRLKVEIEQPSEWKHIKELFIFKERLKGDDVEKIWKEVLDDDYFDKRKLVICSLYSKSFSIIRWRDREK